MKSFLPCVRGTTSACAENTKLKCSTRESAGNYLRVRGEYDFHQTVMAAVKELPPRARRILYMVLKTKQLQGTTSACAENTHLRTL